MTATATRFSMMALVASLILPACAAEDMGDDLASSESAMTSADFLAQAQIVGSLDYGQTSAAWLVGNGTFKNNLLAGGSYALYAQGGPLDSEGNEWSTMITPRGGQFGAVYPAYSFTGTWANNTWAAGPMAGQPVNKP